MSIICLAVVMILPLAGCIRLFLPTSEQELAKQSFAPRSVELDLDYVTAYANLKHMYERCINVGSVYSGVSASGQLDRANGRAQLSLDGAHGTIMARTTITQIAPGKSLLVYVRAKSSFALTEMSEETVDALLKGEAGWATGELTRCG